MFPFVDCQGLGGHWTLGTVQTGGFELVHRASLKGGFGDELIEANRHLVPGKWEQDTGEDESQWDPSFTAAYLMGTPPCSGFSLLNNSAAAARKAGKPVPASARGPESAINDCMWSLIRYAALHTGTDGRPGPEVVSFESVQGAFKQGRKLMQALLMELRQLTGQDYRLTHAVMSGSSIGAAQMRHRYFPVFHRIPFGLEPPEPRKVATYYDAIGDLMGLEDTWDAQRIELGPSTYALEQGLFRSDLMVDAMKQVETGRMRIYLEDLWPMWEPGESLNEPLQRYIERYGATPKGAEKWWDWDLGQRRGFSGPRRIRPDKPGYVLTGGGIFDFIHWEERRFLTVRETARLMGMPDSWTFEPAKGVNQASMWIGKCCPVSSGRWISQHVLNALRGEPGSIGFDGVETGAKAKLSPAWQDNELEFIFNCTNDYRKWPLEISQWTGPGRK